MADPARALTVRGLGASYLDGEERVVFSEVSFEARPGEVLGIVGPNGCGKSTLLRVLAGLHRPSTGTLAGPTFPERATRLAIVPQAFRASFFPWATLRGNLALARPRGHGTAREHAAGVERLAREHAPGLDLSLRPSSASDGMLQQAAILRALAAGPDVLLADEPFAALDVGAARRLRRALRARVVEDGLVAVVVLHDLPGVVELCDRVLSITDRPYACVEREGHTLAELLDNRWRRETGPAADPPVAEIMRRVLGCGGEAS